MGGMGRAEVALEGNRAPNVTSVDLSSSRVQFRSSEAMEIKLMLICMHSPRLKWFGSK